MCRITVHWPLARCTTGVTNAGAPGRASSARDDVLAKTRQGHRRDPPFAVEKFVVLAVVPIAVHLAYRSCLVGPAQHVLHRPDSGGGRVGRDLDLRDMAVVHAHDLSHGATAVRHEGGGTAHTSTL